ncbi:MAG: double-strand break repair helicase AddA [Alphaproteobacteria bacterium]|nr:double-strand break repair helicase AddA [Alphaproteobacteria bacterium]
MVAVITDRLLSALTPSEQHRAADPNASVWVSASAGTGKTRVLTDRVLRLLLGGTPPARILCLTFTNAAAAEMANRVNENLSAWATVKEHELETALLELTGAPPTPADRLTARRLFATVLDAPQGVRIQTIHAFCQSLLARFPLEAGIAPQFAVMDERTARELFREAEDAILSRARSTDDPKLHGALAEVSTYLREDAFFELMGELSLERRRLDDAIERRGGLESTLAQTRVLLGVGDELDEGAMLTAACADASIDAAGLRAAASALLRGTGGDRARGEAVGRWLDDPAGRGARFDEYLALFFKDRGHGERYANLATKKVAAAAPTAFAALISEAERLDAIRERRKAIRLCRVTSAALVVGNALLGEYEAAKRRRIRLDYDDLIGGARDLLERPDVAPWVLYKLDGGIDHILIDEAQDTNPDQWRIVAALAHEFFTGDSAREDVERTIFAVGDPKQSIFSFQRADPFEFARWQENFGTRVRGAGKAWRALPLAESYRSTAPILEAVDLVFKQDRAREGVDLDGRLIEHGVQRKGQAGLVEIWPLEAPVERGEIDLWKPPVTREEYRSPRVELANKIARQIALWLERGERLESRDRVVVPGDIMILVQRRSGFVAEVVRALKKRSVPVAGSDRMILTDQLAVKDLIALGRFVLMPEDDLTLAVVLKSPFVGLGEEALFELGYGRNRKPLWQALLERAGERLDFANARRYLGERLARADFAPPYEFFAEVLAANNGRRELVHRLGPQANDPIDEFIALALQYEQTHIPSLEGFLHWIEAGRVEVKRDHEHGRNEVRVMTVHGAKGLEAPIVFLADTCRVPREEKRLTWITDADGGSVVLWPPRREFEERLSTGARVLYARRQAEEYRRLLYVAMTRASDRSYVCGWRGPQEPPPDCWYKLIEAGLDGTALECALDLGGTGRRLVAAQTNPADRTEVGVPNRYAAPPPAWLERSPAPEPVPPRPLAPSRPKEIDPPVRSPLAPATASPYIRGRTIHRLLERLPDLEPRARAAAAARFVATVASWLDAEAQAEIVHVTMAVIEAPQFATLFGPASRAEVPIVGRIGAYVVAGQIDRLAIGDETVMIVDYKSHRPAPAPANVPSTYLRQMAAYRSVLKEIYPSKSVVCCLLWTDGPNLMRLSEEQLGEIDISNFA